MNKLSHLAIIFTAILSRTALANISLPMIFSDNMIIQQNSEITIYGRAQPDEKLTIKASWNSSCKTTFADKNGQWSQKLKTPKAGGPFNIKLTADNEISINNIMSGEVWFCSGQSNMQIPLKGWENTHILNGLKEINSANCPAIRMFNVQCRHSEKPQTDCTGKWNEFNKQNAIWFSAVAYFFGKELKKELDIPIGLINSSWGDTPVEAWIDKDHISQHKDLKSILEKQYRLDNQYPGMLYNAMVHPFINYKIKGVIWYQGENNRTRATQYKTLFPLLIESWRQSWQQKTLPFYYAQLTSYYKHAPQEDVVFIEQDPSSSCWAQLREAQFETMQVNNTGMAVTIDAGSLNNIHPPDKQTVGKRLALWALAKTYDQNIPYSGPLYKTSRIEGNKIRIQFEHSDGLHFKDGKAKGFAIAAADNEFIRADARIEGDRIVVYSRDIENPASVRYGWSDYSNCNLYNKYELPASPFRTDKLPEQCD